MSKNTGGSAYPLTGMDSEYFHFSWERGMEGMTLRDWFAGQALIGILTNTSYDHNEPHIIAKRAYQMTDAMLAERSK